MHTDHLKVHGIEEEYSHDNIKITFHSTDFSKVEADS